MLAEQYAMRTMKHPKKVPLFDSKLAMPQKAKPASSEVCPRSVMTLQDTYRHFCASIQAADDAQREKENQKHIEIGFAITQALLAMQGGAAGSATTKPPPASPVCRRRQFQKFRRR